VKGQLQQVTREVRNTEKASARFHGQSRNGISLTDRLRSGYHRFWYEASQALGWSRGVVREAPSDILHDPTLTLSQRTRIKKLVAMYGIPFERSYLAEIALLNYAYLDLLDRARQALNWTVKGKQQVCDVGSANFAYSAALHAFFQPAQLVGVEVDGHRLYCNGRSRIDYARGYIQDLPQTEYVTTDYRYYTRPADIITAWYPFVTPKPLLAWRLPLSLFNPGALFAQVANNLIIGGLFIMINHSPDEADVARGIAEDVGLVCDGHYVHEAPLRSRAEYSVLTLWHHG
jgi:hypothetical protein